MRYLLFLTIVLLCGCPAPKPIIIERQSEPIVVEKIVEKPVIVRDRAIIPVPVPIRPYGPPHHVPPHNRHHHR